MSKMKEKISSSFTLVPKLAMAFKPMSGSSKCAATVALSVGLVRDEGHGVADR